jgi:hypothetical protein
MHAYLAATTYKCADCNHWTVKVNILTLKPQCWQCFGDHWCDEEGQLMLEGASRNAVTPFASRGQFPPLPDRRPAR